MLRFARFVSRLHVRLTMLTLSLVVLSTTVLGLFAGYSVSTSQRDEAVDRMRRETRWVASQIDRGWLTSPDRDSLDHQLRRFNALLGVRLTLISTEGRVVADSDVPSGLLGRVERHDTRPEIVAARRGELGQAIRHSATTGVDLLYVALRHPTAVQIGAARQPVEYVRLSLPLRDVRAHLRDVWGQLAAVALGLLALTGLLGAWLANRLTAPLREIGLTARAVASGDLARRAPVTGHDEVGQLGQALNEVATRLGDDITRLQRLERVRSEFLGNVSHELRTPLAAIQGFIETLLDGAIDDPKVNRDFLARAFKQTGRLNALLTDLIEISRIESGELRLSPRYFDLTALVRTITDELRPLAEGRRVSLVVEPGPTVEALGDRDRLRQVLTNLVENAIKYNRDPGEVRLTTVQTPAGPEVRVADTGIGIAADELPRVFERFYRVDRSRSREVGGTGLGLAIVKHLVEAHGGTLIVESKPGVSSTFGFRLPAARLTA